MRTYPAHYTTDDIITSLLRRLNAGGSRDALHDVAMSLLTYAQHGKVDLTDEDMAVIGDVLFGD